MSPILVSSWQYPTKEVMFLWWTFERKLACRLRSHLISIWIQKNSYKIFLYKDKWVRRFFFFIQKKKKNCYFKISTYNYKYLSENFVEYNWILLLLLAYRGVKAYCDKFNLEIGPQAELLNSLAFALSSFLSLRFLFSFFLF